MNLILKRIGKKSGIIILGFILFMGALCTPFVALNGVAGTSNFNYS